MSLSTLAYYGVCYWVAETRSEHVTVLPLNDECLSSVEHARAWY